MHFEVSQTNLKLLSVCVWWNHPVCVYVQWSLSVDVCAVKSFSLCVQSSQCVCVLCSEVVQSVSAWSRHLYSALAPFGHRAAQTQEARRATAALTYTLQKREERERGARERRKIQRRKRRGVTTTPLIERSPHLRPEGAQRGQPSEMRAPGAGPPRPPNSSETPRTWQTVRGEV